MFINVVVQFLFSFKVVSDHILVQINPAEVTSSTGDEGNLVVTEEAFGDLTALPDIRTKSMNVIGDIFFIFKHVGDDGLADRGDFTEVSQFGERAKHVSVLSPEEGETETRETEILGHTPQDGDVVVLFVVLDDLGVGDEGVFVLVAELARLGGESVDFIGEEMHVVLSAPGKHHAEFFFRVNVTSGVGGVSNNKHLDVMAFALGLLAGLLEDLLGNHVVVVGDVSLVHDSTVTERHISTELDEAGSDNDVSITIVKDSGAQNIHRSTGTTEDGEFVVGNRGLADFLGHEVSKSVTKVLSTGTANSVEVIGFVKSAELGILSLKLFPHVNVFSTGDVHDTVVVFRAPGSFRVLSTISHVGRKSGKSHKGFTTTRYLKIYNTRTVWNIPLF